ncbi:pyridoxamine 5'-phosphate oxidase family protein [Streptomyces sp. ME02-8801-2C]|uniref:pyridoxamine 5'-phosphate oxidase family protein n=1 Tax=Streptomyces sp. ME02-8801-2C TaxID=3028680 RepID=UPI0029AC664D|nr:pyridoxamine 5'-phosphate oxidase family protein [Streptomyces sp. ME02-8801-2C]MDX3454051.1 pyridoxamine 5'-phosphate oxidase family protein [Streptomyces sp. ME02-8801-2C]
MPTDEQRAADLLGRVEHGRVATSMRALPCLASARHIVVDGRLLLRLHGGHGYHRACVGGVVAYGADVPSARSRGSWSVQIVGECAAVEPTAAELDRFGPAPRSVDGVPFDPVYLKIEPQFVTVHSVIEPDRP